MGSTRVQAIDRRKLRPALRWVSPAVNFWARVCGKPPIPRLGEELRYLSARVAGRGWRRSAGVHRTRQGRVNAHVGRAASIFDARTARARSAAAGCAAVWWKNLRRPFLYGMLGRRRGAARRPSTSARLILNWAACEVAMKLEGRLRLVAEIDRRERAEMFALMNRHFTNLSRSMFDADLAEKRWAIQVYDPDTESIRGFSTQTLDREAVRGPPDSRGVLGRYDRRSALLGTKRRSRRFGAGSSAR